jgi:hypothetical protein
VRVCQERHKRGLRLSPSGVRSLGLRHDLPRFAWRGKARETQLARQPGRILTEAPGPAREKARQEKEAGGAIETAPAGYLGAPDPDSVGTSKSIAGIDQQTFFTSRPLWIPTAKWQGASGRTARRRCWRPTGSRSGGGLSVSSRRSRYRGGSPMVAPSTVGRAHRMSTRGIGPERTSTRPKGKRAAHPPTALANAARAPGRTSARAWRSARNGTAAWNSCRRRPIAGLASSLRTGRLPANTALGKHPGRPVGRPNP